MKVAKMKVSPIHTPAERRAIICLLLDRTPMVKFEELHRLFPEISQMTLRRDLEYLDKTGMINRIHGGVQSMKMLMGESSCKMQTDEASAIPAEVSAALIADEAVQLLKPAMSVYLDTGTVAYAVAERFPDKCLRVTVSSLGIAERIIGFKKPIVNLIGGIVSRNSKTLVGDNSLRAIDHQRYDLALITPDGYDMLNGFLYRNWGEGQIKKAAIEAARSVAVLLPASQFVNCGSMTLCKPRNVNILLTDRPLPDNIFHQLKNDGVKVKVVSRSEDKQI